MLLAAMMEQLSTPQAMMLKMKRRSSKDILYVSSGEHGLVLSFDSLTDTHFERNKGTVVDGNESPEESSVLSELMKGHLSITGLFALLCEPPH